MISKQELNPNVDRYFQMITVPGHLLRQLLNT